jgi:hypothetical protein
MSLKTPGIIAIALAAAFVLCCEGCTSETQEDPGLLIGHHSNTTFSGYTRTGVSFSGR